MPNKSNKISASVTQGPAGFGAADFRQPSERVNAFDVTVPNLSSTVGFKSVSSLKKYDARQPKALIQNRTGETNIASEETVDTDLHKAVEQLI